MEKRRLDKLGIETSLLGYGCMRFPTTAEGKIDREAAEMLLDKAYEQGVNYFDTAYPYHNGESEAFVGSVLKKYDRSSFYLATKLPLWGVQKLEDVDRIFSEQLERLQMDYVDFYLMHAVRKSTWDKMVELGLIDEIRTLLSRGLDRSCTALQAIGYKEFLAHMDGESTMEEAIEEVKLRSRQYAKRQLTWLRRNKDIFWIIWEKERDFSAAVRLSTDFLASVGIQ